ncbi:MAG TPA: prepilin-type N-terminal cleavage/methylation domain-containing protein, partial [Chthoniobacterales bacterium]|nr:prepilin-type N-terminal cleavage/methylation domain-containing protein [Chthoniobacterales bacterium]
MNRHRLLQPRSEKGMTLIEIVIGIALLGLVAAAAIATLIILNKNAVSTRIMTTAREIVQCNIETAVGSPFTSSNVPAILA